MPDTMMQTDAAMLAGEFQTSSSTAALDEALAKAQGMIAPAAKDKVNPAFRSKYADLASVWEACREALSKNGIAATQWPVHSADGRQHLITRLAHKGEWMLGRFSLPIDKANAHGVGSAVTYLKRFSLAAALGVVADDDDDGNGASERPGAPGTAGGGGQFRNERRGPTGGGVMAAASNSIAEARRDIEAAAPVAPAAKPTNGKKTSAEKAKEFADEGIKFFGKNKDDEAACKMWWSENTKIPSGATASPLAWLHKNFPADHKRLQDAYESVVGFEEAA